MRHNITILVIIFTTSSFLVAQTNTWNGSTDNDWHKECNWSLNTIPTPAHTVVIPTASPYPTITGTAHCDVINITTTAINSVNITGAGTLCISSTNGGACPGVPTDNGGCIVPGSAFSGDGTTKVLFTFDCVATPPPLTNICRNTSAYTNNTSFPITITIPNFTSNTSQSPSAGAYVLSSGSSLTISVCGGGTRCVQNRTHVIPWSSPDGGSGTFTVETGNNL